MILNKPDGMSGFLLLMKVESWRMSLEVFSKGLLDKLQLELNESGNYFTMLRGKS